MHLKVIVSSIMTLHATITYQKRQDYDSSVLPQKSSTRENNQSKLHTLLQGPPLMLKVETGGQLGSAGLELLPSISSFLSLIIIGVGRGLYHCPNVNWQQAVQIGSALHEAGESLMGFLISQSFELHLPRACPSSELPKDDQTKKKKKANFN